MANNKQFSFINTINFFFYRVFRKLLELSLRRSKTKIYKTIEFEELNNPKICLFAHFDTSSKIKDYILFHLQSLKNAGFQIVLVSTSELSETETNKLQGIVATVIIRENIGYDFGSWVTGYRFIEKKIVPSEILLTNDSIYGPIHDIQKIINNMNSKKYDFWGLTDSYEIKYHYQSYFLWISGNVIKSDIWKTWINSFFYYPSEFKSLIINKYEIGFSRLIFKSNFKTGVYISYFDLMNTIGDSEIDNRYLTETYKNSTQNLWDILIENGFPYLKRNLVTHQRINSYKRMNWINKIKKYKNVFSVIEKDLKDI